LAAGGLKIQPIWTVFYIKLSHDVYMKLHEKIVFDFEHFNL